MVAFAEKLASGGISTSGMGSCGADQCETLGLHRGTSPEIYDSAQGHQYIDELMMQVNGGGASIKMFAHGNHLYSIASITNEFGGVVERYSYASFGDRLIFVPGTYKSMKSTVNFELGFTGYVNDRETSLYHARARQYAPMCGKFIARDSVGYIDGASLYLAYFAPNKLDPYGLWELSVRDVLNGGDLLQQLLRDLWRKAEGQYPKIPKAADAIGYCVNWGSQVGGRPDTLKASNSIDVNRSVDAKASWSYKGVGLYASAEILLQGKITVDIELKITRHDYCCKDDGQTKTRYANAVGDPTFTYSFSGDWAVRRDFGVQMPDSISLGDVNITL